MEMQCAPTTGVTRVRLSAGTAGPDAGDRGARPPRLPRRGRQIWAERYTPHAERGQIIRPLVKSSTHEAARMLESVCATASDEPERTSLLVTHCDRLLRASMGTGGYLKVSGDPTETARAVTIYR
jgi:hypothetical protein